MTLQNMQRTILESPVAALATMVFLLVAYSATEPMIGRAVTDDVVVNQSVTSGISISNGADITMSALSVSQNTSVGSSVWNVITNNAAGYSLTLQASAAPALSGSSGSFADYTPASASTPETWAVANAYEFGFSVRGSDVNTTTYGTDSDCLASSNVPSSTLKWRGFSGVTPIAAASAGSQTSVSGSSTTMCVAAEQNGVFAPSGSYSATITATATAN